MLRKAARGFTLIELMIVVAIIGILAAIAIPNFMRYQLRSKRSEGSVNVASLRTSEISYYATHDTYVAAVPEPAIAGISTSKRPWAPAATHAFVAELGWSPEGQVYYSYGVNITAATANGGSFLAVAEGDLDGSGAGTNSCWAYGKPNSAGAVAAAYPTDMTCTNATKPAASTHAGYEKVDLITPDNQY